MCVFILFSDLIKLAKKGLNNDKLYETLVLTIASVSHTFCKVSNNCKKPVSVNVSFFFLSVFVLHCSLTRKLSFLWHLISDISSYPFVRAMICACLVKLVYLEEMGRTIRKNWIFVYYVMGKLEWKENLQNWTSTVFCIFSYRLKIVSITVFFTTHHQRRWILL